MDTPPEEKKKSPAPALILAFVPSALMLLVVGGRGRQLDRPTLICTLFISFVCCLASSGMLFQRRTTLAIVAGVLFMLLNGAVCLGLGCASCITY